jgi:uncharacterized protein (DUF305 family)
MVSKEYLETARTLLRAAQNMTDRRSPSSKRAPSLRRVVMEVNMASLHSSVRKRLVSLAMTVSILTTTPIAFAQDQIRTRHVPAAASNRTELQFIVDNDLAISKMSLDMSKMADPTGDVDRDFVALMMPHHQAAIDMARAELKYGHNEELRRLAQSIIAEREHEMSAMRGAVGETPPSQTSDKTVPESKGRP